MRPIPDMIKAEIFKKYLEGDSIPLISESCGVSDGAVHAITSKESQKDESIRYIREITKYLRKII